MDDTRDVAQYCQEDVDEEVGIATTLEEDTEGREDDGEDDLANVATFRATSVVILMTARRTLRSWEKRTPAEVSGTTSGRS